MKRIILTSEQVSDKQADEMVELFRRLGGRISLAIEDEPEPWWDRATTPCVLGFESPKFIAPGEIATVSSAPQHLFRPQQLWVDPRCAKDFMLYDLKVGAMSAFANQQEIPAGAFATHDRENAPWFVCSTAKPGQIIAIMVRNRGSDPVIFSAALFGKAPAPADVPLKDRRLHTSE